MPKFVPETKFQELKGLDRISTIVHDMRHFFREIAKDDVGIDGEIEILAPNENGKGYHATGAYIKVQSKSGMSYVSQNTETDFSTSVKKDDLEYWSQSNCPTIYIIYHPEDDKLYWKEIQSYIKSTPNVWAPPYKIKFSKETDEFNASCRNKLFSTAQITPPRVSVVEKEQLYSNLFPIAQLSKMWSAPFKAQFDVNEVRRATSWEYPFFIFNGQLHTLSDLNDEACTLRSYCDVGAIQLVSVSAIYEDEALQRNYIYLLNQVLHAHLRKGGVEFDRKSKRHYFPRPDDKMLPSKRPWYNVRLKRFNSPGIVTTQFYTYGKDKFWRHTAADLRFIVLGTKWFLQIEPQYMLTTDGYTHYEASRVGRLVTKVKSLQRNNHVLNQVLFWSDVVAKCDATFTITNLESKVWFEGKAIMTIAKLPLIGIANFAILIDPAIYDDEIEEEEVNVEQLTFDLFDWNSGDEDSDD